MPLNTLNFGICGDRTQDVLWRVQNGILDHIKPKVDINFEEIIIYNTRYLAHYLLFIFKHFL